ncbi:helix-turn-helix domain-containing protein [Leucobacter rhizosphaerae]|uniref:Helix-turn-helix domain-containing protein n=1 Tax=Leucobacter rhizosphaerae TaxID=2932245 RepID=A0ABY4FYA0_9MICO|nr:helix-turn-helix domain-containing protein [Leucobacter rhizosphaerae]UOQ61280.1 helix-turn-helix domain-containing protein [Leucobacter rhizosphaerae]
MRNSIEAASTVMRTDDFDLYQQTVDHSFVPLKITPDAHHRFSASMRGVDADDVAFTEVAALPQLVERTPENISRGGSGYYKVSLLLAGSSILIQDGREVVMKPGDISFYDTSQPYSLLFDEQFRNLIMMFPKSRLDFPAHVTESLTAVSLGDQHPLAHVVAEFISRASPHLHLLSGPARAKLAHSSLELLNSTLSAVFDVDAPPHDPHQALLQKITGYIEQHLGSPRLSPDAIAAAHYVSTRHLHALFRETGTTVSTWIKERRLERCRLDLVDPAFAHLGVAAVAANRGFVDAAHFSRSFRAAYGMSPTELRRAV